MSGIDLSQLTAPDAIEALDFETLLAARKARLVSLYPADEQAAMAALLEIESEPIVRLLQENCYRELLLRARYNDDVRAVLLAYATGSNLDHIGVTYYQEARLLVTPADTTTLPPTAAVYEADDDYRQRCASKPASYSTAGPAGAYRWHAKSASTQVLDAHADSPEPGVVRVTVLSTVGDGTPDSALLAAVNTVLNDESIRPLTDEVLVIAADVTHYDLVVTLYVLPGPDASVIQTEALAALRAYTDSRRRLGYDVTLSGLYAAAHRSGVQRAALSLSADIVCTPQQSTWCESLNVIVAGTAQ